MPVELWWKKRMPVEKDDAGGAADADEYAIAKGRDQMRKHCGPQQIIVPTLFGSDLITFTFLCVVFTLYVVCCFSK